MTNLHVAHPVFKMMILIIMLYFFWETFFKICYSFQSGHSSPIALIISLRTKWVRTYWYLTSPMIGSLSYFIFLMGSILIYKWACICHFICILIYIHFFKVGSKSTTLSSIDVIDNIAIFCFYLVPICFQIVKNQIN